MKPVQFTVNRSLSRISVLSDGQTGLRQKISESILDGPMADVYTVVQNKVDNDRRMQYYVGIIAIVRNSRIGL